MGGSQQIKPRFLTPPDIGSLRPDYAAYLGGLLRQGQGGANPLYTPLNPLQNAALQQYSGLLTGQGISQNTPFGAASRGLTEQIETGFPVNLSPLYANASNTFSRDIAPNIMESLGANYGIRFGTPVAESLSRAGRDVALGTQAQALPYIEAAQGRRAAGVQQGLNIPQQGFQMGEQVRGGEQDALQFLQQLLQGGVGGLSSQGQFQNPAFAPSSGQQTLQTVAQLAAAYAAIAGGFCWIAEAIYGVGSMEVILIRTWLHQVFRKRWYGRPILWLYSKVGRYVARIPFLVRLLRPAFAAALSRATSTYLLEAV